MKYAEEAKQLANKCLSQIRNITELMNSTFKRQQSRLTGSHRQLRLVRSASAPQRKHKKTAQKHRNTAFAVKTFLGHLEVTKLPSKSFAEPCLSRFSAVFLL